MTTTNAIVNAFGAALKVPNGASPYTYDLTATGRVIETQEVLTALPCPSVQWAITGIPESYEPADLTRFSRSMEITMVGAAPATADTPTAHRTAVMNLADDIHTTLRANRDLGGLVNDIGPMSVTLLRGDAFGMPSTVAVFVGSVSVIWWEPN